MISVVLIGYYAIDTLVSVFSYSQYNLDMVSQQIEAYVEDGRGVNTKSWSNSTTCDKSSNCK